MQDTTKERVKYIKACSSRYCMTSLHLELGWQPNLIYLHAMLVH